MDNCNFQNPLVSVVTPVYNSPDLWSALDSVLSQTYPEIEYVLVDDCSQGFSDSEIRQYIEARHRENLRYFSILKNTDNLGTVKTVNRGIENTHGEYIFFLAGDDVFADSEVLKEWFLEFQKTKALVITAKRDAYDENLEKYIDTYPTEEQIKKIQSSSPYELFEELAAENFILGCCTAYKKECFERYGLFDTRYHLIEDHSMNLKLLRQNVRIEFFDRVVVKHRGNGTSSLGKFDSIYEHDADLVFENEVLPYTKYPRRAKKKYVSWKKRRSLDKRFMLALEEANNKPVKVFFVRTWYYSHHIAKALSLFIKSPRRFFNVLRKSMKGAV